MMCVKVRSSRKPYFDKVGQLGDTRWSWKSDLIVMGTMKLLSTMIHQGRTWLQWSINMFSRAATPEGIQTLPVRMVIFHLGIPDVILTAAALLHWWHNCPWDWDPLWSNDKMQLKQLTKTLPKLNLADELTNVHNPGANKTLQNYAEVPMGPMHKLLKLHFVKKNKKKQKLKHQDPSPCHQGTMGQLPHLISPLYIHMQNLKYTNTYTQLWYVYIYIHTCLAGITKTRHWLVSYYDMAPPLSFQCHRMLHRNSPEDARKFETTVVCPKRG